jgi:predicted ArsR family transcriptional regulator
MRNAKRKERQSQVGTTRWKILVMLCREHLTVDELAVRLGVTDNAVRAQLQRLERDGFVAKTGFRPGVRRPHVEYHLTLDARTLFPTAYEPVLSALVDVLAERNAQASRQLLLKTGRRLLRERIGNLRGRTAQQRLTEAVLKLNGSSNGIEIINKPAQTIVRTCSCPLASVVAVQPMLCSVFATLLTELLDTNVSESCEKGESARCCFHVATH